VGVCCCVYVYGEIGAQGPRSRAPVRIRRAGPPSRVAEIVVSFKVGGEERALMYWLGVLEEHETYSARRPARSRGAEEGMVEGSTPKTVRDSPAAEAVVLIGKEEKSWLASPPSRRGPQPPPAAFGPRRNRGTPDCFFWFCGDVELGFFCFSPATLCLYSRSAAKDMVSLAVCVC